MALELRAYLDDKNQMWVCIGPENGCSGRDVVTEGPCENCIRARHGETLEELTERLKRGEVN